MRIPFRQALKKTLSCGLVLIFGITTLSGPVYAQILVAIPPKPVFEAPILLGLKIHPENPFLFDFIVDPGQARLSDEEFKRQSEELVKYFMAALTIPDKDVWVNLSPNEKDRIIPSPLDRTEMGKIMLKQDYELKQLAASLTSPDTELGKKYWISADTRKQKTDQLEQFSKVWIVPDKAKVIEHSGIVWIDDSQLKILMASEYQDARSTERQATVFREMILPKINEAVNHGKAFIPVRQVYNSVILAAWYKKTLKENLLGKIYTDKAKTAGVEILDPTLKERIYEAYLKTFKKGAYNLIQEEEDETTGEIIPRKYFSGGVEFGQNASSALEITSVKGAQLAGKMSAGSALRDVRVQLGETGMETQFLAQAQPQSSSSGLGLAIPVILSKGAQLFDKLLGYSKDKSPFKSDRFWGQYERDPGLNKKLARMVFSYIYMLVAGQNVGSVVPDQAFLKGLKEAYPLNADIQNLAPSKLVEILTALNFTEQQGRYYNNLLLSQMKSHYQSLASASVVSSPLTDWQVLNFAADLFKAKQVAGDFNGDYLKTDSNHFGKAGALYRRLVLAIYQQDMGFDINGRFIGFFPYQLLQVIVDPYDPLARLLDNQPFEIREESLDELMNAIGYRLEDGVWRLSDRDLAEIRDMLQTAESRSSSGIQENNKITPIVSGNSTASVAVKTNDTNVGGIDFDPSRMDLQIKRDGKGVPLPLPQQNLDQIQIQGLYPVIIQVAPINPQTLPMFLGQIPQAEQQNSLQSKG